MPTSPPPNKPANLKRNKTRSEKEETLSVRSSLFFLNAFVWERSAVEYKHRCNVIVLEHFYPVQAVLNVFISGDALAQFEAAGISAFMKPAIGINCYSFAFIFSDIYICGDTFQARQQLGMRKIRKCSNMHRAKHSYPSNAHAAAPTTQPPRRTARKNSGKETQDKRLL